MRVYLAFLASAVTLGISLPSVAAAPPIQPPDLKIIFHDGLLEATAPPAHHFNVEAPAQVLLHDGGGKIPFKLNSADLKAILPSGTAGKDVDIQVFVCDDAKTFCLKKKQLVHIPDDATTGSAHEAAETPASKTPATPSAKPHTEKDTGFIVNDPNKAFKLAAQKKLPLMIDFFGIWCPPCNHLDAMVFRSTIFRKKNEKRFVLLKLDADQERFNELKNRYKIQGLPTVVFATSAGEEIFRLLGFHSLEEMTAKAEAAYTARETGYFELVALAGEGGNAEAQYKAASIALDRDEPEKALEWLKPMKELFVKTNDPRRAQLYRAELGLAQAKENKTEAKKILKKWLQEFPNSLDSIENYQTLADLEQQEGNTVGRKESLTLAVVLTEKLMLSDAKSRSLQGSYYTHADLAETRADIYEKLEDTAHLQTAYLDCAQAYMKEAHAEGKGFARGPNLERGYCLGKAGKLAESEAIYKEGIKRFPEEYTFYAGLARLWLDAGKDPKKALNASKQALRYAYGNQRLKGTIIQVKALGALGDFKQGLQVIETTLSQPPVPPVTPGTLSLRRKLEAKREEFKKAVEQGNHG